MANPLASLPSFVAGVPGGWELIVILLILLLLFGRKIPGVARSLGQGISSFKKGLNEPLEDEDRTSKKDLPRGEDPSTT